MRVRRSDSYAGRNGVLASTSATMADSSNTTPPDTGKLAKTRAERANLGSHGPLERFEHRVEVPGPVVADAVDEQRWRTGDAVPLTLSPVLLDARPGFRALQIRREAGHVEAQLPSVLDHRGLRDGRRAVVDEVVHLPEAALIRRRLGGAGDAFGAGMGALVGEVPKGVDEAVAQRLPQPQQHPAQPLAIRTEEVRVGDDGDGVRHAAAPDMVALRIDGVLQANRRRLAAGTFLAGHRRSYQKRGGAAVSSRRRPGWRRPFRTALWRTCRWR